MPVPGPNHRTYLNQVEGGTGNVSLGVLAKSAYLLGESLSRAVGVADRLNLVGTTSIRGLQLSSST